ncbi:TetR/AcrR family transcriptional regulator [Actinacidiphila sp. bgisy144]|uniref:TetR/AcrR family transcriptional regulator n=1 Tax=Actinacidiphila sp. bgisy144 TaxID=3413791 RepID=UPI003EB8AFC8
MTSSAVPAYRRMSVEQRREQLLAAALDLFGHRRPEDVSVEDVAAAAGVSRPLVYRYFPGGKQQLYESAVLGAAEELVGLFGVPAEGPPTQRLADALDGYLGYVDEHDAAYGALLRGGGVVGTSRTEAIIEGVRSGAAAQVLHHLGVAEPGPRLTMMVRSWIASVETVSLLWLDNGKQPPLPELRAWLVNHFTALLLATALTDPEAAEAAARALSQETPASPGRLLLTNITTLFP